MAQLIQLQPIPNQSFSIPLEGNRFVLRFMKCSGVMACDIEINEKVILTGQRCVAGEYLIPYEYLEEGAGNFGIVTENDALPDYREFGDTQELYYFTGEEVRGSV